MTATAFYEPILVSEFVSRCCNIRDMSKPLSDADTKMVKRALKGVRVELIHRDDGKQYKISNISTQPTNCLMFSRDKTGEQISVDQYYLERYNKKLRFSHLPALQVGNDSKPVYLPMEISWITPRQRYTQMLNDTQISSLLRASCRRPKDREKSTNQIVVNNSYNSNSLIKEFGLWVDNKNTAIRARVLPPPVLKYLDTQEAPKVGAWDMEDKKMVSGAKVKFWASVCFASSWDRDGVRRFCGDLISVCKAKGMDFYHNPLLPPRVAQPCQIEETLVDIHKKSEAKLAGKQLLMLIVILPDMAGAYGTIKRLCETDLGIISQCCQPQKASRPNKQYLENMALKINVKAGGRNWVLQRAIDKKLPYGTDMKTIIFGADITHPQPGDDSSPSIAAVVASMDWPEVTKYRALMSAQSHRDEIIHDLYGMIKDQLLAFYKSNSCERPSRIIFYRDGISEGQFGQVVLNEVDAIRKACLSLQESYLPRITFVVVQKRHHTRLFPTQHGDRDAATRSGNILPGTVVDTKICHPSEFDFFLCSHAGIQGTSRPTHYHVLYDENKFTADGLQMLTYHLCFTYARCTRSVSVVPPAYYAHLAAFRARHYLEGGTSENGSTSAGNDGGDGSGIRERVADIWKLPKTKKNVKDVMFFC